VTVRTPEEAAVTYGALGASDELDLMRFPPKGFRPFERRARIGFGDERWDYAWAELMSWGVQERSGMRVERVSDPEGERPLVAGDTVVLHIPAWPVNVSAPARVVWIVEEPERRGFAYGTLPGHPERGEEAFVLHRERDGSIWIVVRGFARPARFWRLVAPLLRLTQRRWMTRYLRALAGPVKPRRASTAA
jgi:uncharacterized protein (UPF0548 family)